MFLSFEDQQLDLKGIEAVIFDLDGTLVESEPVWAEAKKYIANREKVHVSKKVFWHTRGVALQILSKKSSHRSTYQ